MPDNHLIYLSNAGVLLNIDQKKVLIDVLSKTDSVYKNPTAQTVEKIINNEAPFDNIDVMLITHHHEDHFDVKSVSRFVLNNKKAVVISSAKVISLIRAELSAADAYGADVRRTDAHEPSASVAVTADVSGSAAVTADFNVSAAVTADRSAAAADTSAASMPGAKLIALASSGPGGEKLNANGLEIIAVSLLHDGVRFEQTPHYGFLINGSSKVFHTGDAAGRKENYQSLCLSGQRPDLLLAPFPYIGLSSVRQVIQEYIKPRKIALLHLPDEKRDLDGWIAATKKSYQNVAAAFTEAVFLENLGTIMSL